MSDLLSSTSYHALLHEELSQWRVLAKGLRDDIALKSQQLDEVMGKIDAAERLLGLSKPASPQADAPKPSLQESIERVMEDGLPRNTTQIRDALVALGFDRAKIGSHSARLYNAISYLFGRGRLIKNDLTGQYTMPSGRMAERQKEMIK